MTSYGGRENWRSKDVCRWEFDGIQRRAAALGFRVEVFPLSEYRNDAERLVARRAPILAQPSVPFPVGRAHRADLNLSPAGKAECPYCSRRVRIQVHPD